MAHEADHIARPMWVTRSAAAIAPWVPTGREGAYDALVLDARLRQSLLTVRSLGKQGLYVASLGTSGGLPAFSSRWCQQAYVCPGEEGTEDYYAYLQQMVEDRRMGVLITSSDATIALIRAHRAQLERKARVALACEPALGIALDKARTLAIAERLGIGVPRAFRVESADDLSRALVEIGLPAVVKPARSWAAVGLGGCSLSSRLVVTRQEAERTIEDVIRAGVPALFQQLLLGRREAVMLMFAEGKIFARFAQWAKRTVPPLGGVSVFRQSIATPDDIGLQAEHLVREIGLEGYCEVEFRRDCDGKPYLMEINPRLSASVEVAVRAGVDFPYLLYRWAAGDRLDEVRSYRVGGWMRYLKGDLVTTWATVRHERGRPGMARPIRALLDFWLAFLTPAGYDYMDWRDPLPAWRATASFLTVSIQSLWKKAGAAKVGAWTRIARRPHRQPEIAQMRKGTCARWRRSRSARGPAA